MRGYKGVIHSMKEQAGCSALRKLSGGITGLLKIFYHTYRISEAFLIVFSTHLIPYIVKICMCMRGGVGEKYSRVPKIRIQLGTRDCADFRILQISDH